MLKINLDDTIAAIATPVGSGGIGIVRISGSDAIKIADSLFVPNRGKALAERKSNTISYGKIVYQGEVCDEVLVSIMKAPNTYTCENVAEINCHGGIRAVTAVLEAVLKSGARLAEPGEFTKRAFLNGRIDLTQAEAVIDIINAKTDRSKEAALKRLEGKLSAKIKSLREEILLLIANIEAAIDYPEHDDETMTYETVAEGAKKAVASIESLIKGADVGKIYKEGIKTVILGRPNVGKSSLLNNIIDEERAIVTDIPGTTRDVLEEMISINGIPLKLIDTAGIRNTDNVIEKIGVEKSRKLASEADLVLLVLDGSRQLSQEDRELIDLSADKKRIVLVNKIDLEQQISLDEIKSLTDSEPVNISAKHDKGIEDLYDRIRDMFFKGNIDINDEALISNERNKNSLYKARDFLYNVIETVNSRMPEDFISMDLTQAYEALGEITGEALEEDIIDKIFSEFCLGK